jgi:type IV pilus assembly protein PilA
MGRRGSSQRGFTLIELLIVVAIIAIIAAIAIPALLRARIAANESAAIGDMRTVISGEASYLVANGGYYDGNFVCLTTPVDCIPDYPSNGPNFLDSAITGLVTKSGYARSYAGGQTPSGLNTAVSSASSATSYVYWATPAIGGQTGIRGFAADHSGLICFSPQGAMAATTGSIALLSPGNSCNILQD